jgi:hypothetical protein
MATLYTASDGRLVLTLTPAEEGGFVTSLMEPDLITKPTPLRMHPVSHTMAPCASRVQGQAATEAHDSDTALGMNRRVVESRAASDALLDARDAAVVAKGGDRAADGGRRYHAGRY